MSRIFRLFDKVESDRYEAVDIDLSTVIAAKTCDVDGEVRLFMGSGWLAYYVIDSRDAGRINEQLTLFAQAWREARRADSAVMTAAMDAKARRLAGLGFRDCAPEPQTEPRIPAAKFQPSERWVLVRHPLCQDAAAGPGFLCAPGDGEAFRWSINVADAFVFPGPETAAAKIWDYGTVCPASHKRFSYSIAPLSNYKSAD